MNNSVFVDFSRIFILGILIFKGLTARRLYKSFGVKGLMKRLLRLKPSGKFCLSWGLFSQHSLKTAM
jgi:hypothetical protein